MKSSVDVCRKCETLRLGVALGRSKKHGNPATLTLDEWLASIAAFGGKCAYCSTADFEDIEHVVPETASSAAGTVAGNCVPACSSCNAKKGSSSPKAWNKKFPGAAERIRAAMTACRFVVPDMSITMGSHYARKATERVPAEDPYKTIQLHQQVLDQIDRFVSIVGSTIGSGRVGRSDVVEEAFIAYAGKLGISWDEAAEP